LTKAVLKEARIADANFTGANLKGINLQGAKYNNKTIWPDGFNPDKYGAIYEES